MCSIIIVTMIFFKEHGNNYENLKNPWFCNREEPNPNVGSVSFTLTFASHCSCSLKGYCLYIMACLGEPCPSAWMLHQSAFVQGNIQTLSTCGMLQEKKITHPLPEASHSRGYLQNLWSFNFTSSSPPPPPTPFYKRNWHPTPDKMLRH